MNKLKNIAQELGADDVSLRIQKAEMLESRSQKHVGIIGAANCGKSTLINGILHREVRKPSVIPFDGLPLRVVFDRMTDDERFECVHVFQQEWSNADAVLYEFSSEKALKDEQWIDELDMLFYLSPLSHFMTAEDKKAVQSFEGIPVQIIATQCDRVAVEDVAKAQEFAIKACERIGLPAPIFSDPDNWQSVSEKMRSALPTTAELIEKRKEHVDKIEKSCRSHLVDYVERLIEAEESNQQLLQAQHEAQVREEKLALATANRIYQEMKLRCSSSSNEMVALVRKSIQEIDGFAQQLISEGKQCKFDETFRQRMPEQAESFLNEQILSIESNLKVGLNSIVADALAQMVLTEKDLQTFKQTENLSRSSQKMYFDKGTGNELSYLLQSALGVGAVSAATLLSRATMPWAIGLITASTLAGGATYLLRNELTRTVKNEAVIRNWARSCSDELQSTAVPAIQRAYKTLSDAMQLPPVKQTASTSAPTETERAVRLRAIASGLKA